MNNIRSAGGPIKVFSWMEGQAFLREMIPHNLVVNQAADIVTRLLAGDIHYTLATAYFEFTNTGTPAPTPTKTGGQSYYAGLAASGKDFLRVPLNTGAAISSSDSAYAGNVAAFTALGAGSVGHFGLPFSQVAGSAVIGIALVASPTGDFADDLVYARVYYATAQAKLNGVTPGFTWPMTQTAP